MDELKLYLREILAGPLTPEEARSLAEYMLTRADDVARAAVLAALRARGEAGSEVAGFSMALRSMAVKVNAPGRVLDTAGTGGDGSSTLNASTAAAIVAAAGGALTAKHGNRSISGRSGSADFMERLGYNIGHDAETARCMLERIGFTFLYAPAYHKIMAAVAPVRRRLGVRTIFNLAGPLSNPAQPSVQLLGVSEPRLLEVMSQAGRVLGYERLLVVHGSPGIDEVSVSGETLVSDNGRVYTLAPEDLGLEPCSLEDLRVASPSESVTRALEAMNGGGRRCDRAFIAANAGLALYAYGLTGTPARGVSRALDVMENGEAARLAREAARLSHEGCPG